MPNVFEPLSRRARNSFAPEPEEEPASTSDASAGTGAEDSGDEAFRWMYFDEWQRSVGERVEVNERNGLIQTLAAA